VTEFLAASRTGGTEWPDRAVNVDLEVHGIGARLQQLRSRDSAEVRSCED
jgi:hypothetical protein